MVGYTNVSRLRIPVPGYAWLRKLVTQPGSRLRRVMLVAYAARLRVLRKLVTQPGSQLRMVT